MAVDAARAKSLFLNASELADPAARVAYLERECGGDAELRQRADFGDTIPNSRREMRMMSPEVRMVSPEVGSKRTTFKRLALRCLFPHL